MHMNTHEKIIVSLGVLVLGGTLTYGAYRGEEPIPPVIITEQQLLESSNSLIDQDQNKESSLSAAVSQKGVRGTASVQKKPSVSVSQYRNCTAADLEGGVILQNMGGILRGSLKLVARPTVTCTLNGPLMVQVIKNGLSPIVMTVSTPSLKNFNPTTAGFASVVWSNYCGPVTNGQVSLRVAFPGDNGYLLIPAFSSNGIAQTGVPSCINTAANSSMTIGVVQ